MGTREKEDIPDKLPYFRDPFVLVQHPMDRFPKPEPAVIVRGIPYVRVTQQEEVGAEEGSGDSVVYRCLSSDHEEFSLPIIVFFFSCF